KPGRIEDVDMAIASSFRNIKANRRNRRGDFGRIAQLERSSHSSSGHSGQEPAARQHGLSILLARILVRNSLTPAATEAFSEQGGIRPTTGAELEIVVRLDSPVRKPGSRERFASSHFCFESAHRCDHILRLWFDVVAKRDVHV